MSRILMVGSEAIPFAKTGGLADVLGALPPALVRAGHDVAVLLPRYTAVPMQGAVRVGDPMTVWLGGSRFDTRLWRIDRRGVRFFLLEYDPFYARPELYGDKDGDYPDNAERFALLSRAAFEVLRYHFRADIVHCHDWQSGLVPAYLKGKLALDPTFAAVRTLFTIHNLGYQGRFPKALAPSIDLTPEQVQIDGAEFFGDVNYLKAGIVYSDAVSTVSKRYAVEIQSAEFGFGLDALLRGRANVLSGIVNGVDYSEWNPETDPYIAAHYSAADLTGKRKCKFDLLHEFHLPTGDLDRPVFGMVTRLATQKGVDLFAAVAEELIGLDVCLVLIGSGDPVYEDFLRDLAARYPARVGVFIGYDNRRAHKVEAGADMFLMPSRYEPCGLSQIYSLRYGTLPVVRATGGLDDTIEEGTGFKFLDYSVSEFMGAIRNALNVYTDRAKWTGMMRLAMSRDFSWDHSAREYTELYHRLAG